MNIEERLELFSAHTKEFLDALAMVPEAHRHTSVAGGWSAAYVVHHMADADLHFTSRYLHAIGDINPNIIPFDEEAYPERVNYAMRKVKTSLAAIVGIRALAAEILANANEADWNKVSNHPELGAVTLAELFERGDKHMVGHTQQLKEIAANF
jgi:uncharacterized damage-inducible protein DinB